MLTQTYHLSGIRTVVWRIESIMKIVPFSLVVALV